MVKSRTTDLTRLVLANSISTAGDSATYLTVFLFVSERTGSAEILVYLALLLAVPRILASLIPGGYLDRLNKRRTLLSCEAGNAILTLLTVPALLSGEVAYLFALQFLKAVLTSIYNPVRSAVLPSLVEGKDLMRAYSTLNSSKVVASVLGTALAGLLIGTNNLYWPALAFDACTFIVSFFLFFSITKMPDEVEVDSVDWSAASSGFSIIRSSSVLKTALVFGVSLTIALEFYNALYVPLISQSLKAGPAWFSIIEAVQAVAILIAGVVTARTIGLHRRPMVVAVVSSLFMGASILSMGLVKNVQQFLGSIFLMGVAEIPLSSSMQTLIQKQLSDSVRVRVAATINAGVALAEICGLLMCLILIRFTSVASIFLLSGAAIIVVTLLVALGQRQTPSQELANG